MALDSLVQKRFALLSERPMEDPLFNMPQHLLDAMLLYTEPLPLHWADAIASIANVRVDESPMLNVQKIILSLGFVDSAYARYRGERLVYLEERGAEEEEQEHQQVAAALLQAGRGASSSSSSSSGAGSFPSSSLAAGLAAATSPAAAHAAARTAAQQHADKLRASRGLEVDDLVPVFHYIVAKSNIDHPVLCAVLAGTWLQQHGLRDGRDGYAVSLFKAACEWAASLE